MDVRHFLRRLTYAEAGDFLEGVERRYRAEWECAQLIGNIMARCAGQKKDVVGRFPWQLERKAHTPPTEEDMEALRRFRERVESKNRRNG